MGTYSILGIHTQIFGDPDSRDTQETPKQYRDPEAVSHCVGNGAARVW